MSRLPETVRAEVESSLEERTGRPVPLVRTSRVSGGSINPAARVETGDGDSFFLKWNPSAPEGMFAAEADGLDALADAAGEDLRVPDVVAVAEGGPGPSWLLLEFVPRGRDDGGWAGRLGREMVALHGHGGDVGWHRDNFIGSLPQTNRTATRSRDATASVSRTWGRFWTDARIRPQLGAARERGHLGGRAGRALDDLVARIPEILEGSMADGPSLLHGDLWGGNVFPDPRGRPVLVDPAVYRGHREVDLAMSELFGFPRGFLPAYREASPVDPGYDAFRRDLYQLYYLLVHVNLFGSGYEAGCLRAATRVLAAV